MKSWLVAFALFVSVLLLLDGEGLARQAGLSVATCGFLILLARRFGVDGRQIVCAILVATAGEIVLSLGWGLYSYQHALIPLYVPPGHGLFYAMAVIAARQRALQKHESSIVAVVLLAGTAGALASLFFLRDVWGALWWSLVALFLLRGHNRLLLASCVVLTTALEWMGTTIGNWQWAAEVPFLGLPAGNPPAGVAILYVVLDSIVMWIVRKPSAQQFRGSAIAALDRAGDGAGLVAARCFTGEEQRLANGAGEHGMSVRAADAGV